MIHSEDIQSLSHRTVRIRLGSSRRVARLLHASTIDRTWEFSRLIVEMLTSFLRALNGTLNSRYSYVQLYPAHPGVLPLR
jgi:hypothetical protein